MTSNYRWVAVLLSGLVLALLGACTDGDTEQLSERVTIEDLGIASITVSSSKDIIAVAEVLTLTAVEGTSGDDLASTLTWMSSDSAVATVAAGGVVTGVGDGVVTITAGIGGVEGSTMLTVSSAGLLSIDISSAADPIDVCTSTQFTATGTFADGRTDDLTDEVVWTSADTGIATFDAATLGQLNTSTAGTLDVTASFESVTSPTLSVVISNSLTQVIASLASTSIEVGATTTITASGSYGGTQQDITANSTFASATTSVATVDEAGTITAVTSGTSTLSATCNALSGETTLTVTDASTTRTLVDLEIEGTPPFQLSLGQTLQLTALAEYSDGSTQDVTEQSTWTIPAGSFNAVSVDNTEGNRGVLTGLLLGNTSVRAQFETEDDTVAVTVVP